ncbi:hypothetical protein SteCoe_27246 [Stentor coeruleus]|uniref:VWFA domain-containing protein n=1 Tax=Stentor coeruleus TaxID=5963 RepID=A0A1R2BAW3_9CILI|nr:hypothetical protein SteCoe_27246 [Stentor coeruleus]
MVRKYLLVLALLISSSYAQDDLLDSDSVDDGSEELTDSTVSLDSLVAEAEAELDDGELVSSTDILEDATSLANVLNEMQETNTETVNILGIEYTQESLADYIEELEIQAQEQEDIENAVAEAEDILDDGDEFDPTSLQLYDYADALQIVLDLMDEDDVAVIFDEEYTYTELQALIDQTLEEAEEIEAEEDAEEEALDALADDLVEEIIVALESDDLTDEETVELESDIEELLTVADEDVVIELDSDEAEDEELTLDDLSALEEDLEEELDIDEDEAEVNLDEELSDNEESESSEELEEDLEAVEDAIEALDDESTITIDGEDYDEEELESLADDIELDLESQIELEESVDDVNEILEDDDLSSEELDDLAEALNEVVDEMEEDDTVVINDETLTIDEVEELADEALEDAEEAEELEAIAAEEEEALEEELAIVVSESLESEDLTLDEEEDLLDDLEELIASLEEDEEIIIDGDELTIEDLEEEAEELEEDIAETEEIIEAESVIEDGEDATAEDYEDLIDELDDLDLDDDEIIVIEGEEIEGEDELEEYIEDLEDLVEDLEDIEALEEEIAEAEALMVDLETANSAQLFELAEELMDVLDLMEEDETVQINDVGYSYDALEDYIEDLYEESEVLEHEEELDEAVEEAVAALGDGSTSEQLAAYVIELEEILDIMEEDDVVVINDVEYNQEEIEEEIESTVEEAQELKALEDLEAAIEAVEEAEDIEEEELDTSAEVQDIIDDYENLIDIMEDTDELVVDINDEETTVDDLEEDVEDFNVVLTDLASQEELDALAAEIETYVLQYVSEDGTVYITAEQLSGELALWKELQAALDEGEVVFVNGFEYTIDNIDDFIAVVEDTVTYLDENDLVQVVVDGVISYMPEDEYIHMLSVDSVVDDANDILALDELTSDDLYELSDILETLLDLIYTDEIVVLDGVEYNYEELEIFIDEIKAEAMNTDHQEEIDEAANEVEELIQNNDEWTTQAELTALVAAWEDLLDVMEIGDIAIVDYKEYDIEAIQAEISELTTLNEQLESGKVLYTDPETGEVEEATAEVTESATLTSQAYHDLITSSIDFNEDIPVVSTATSSEFIANESGVPLIEIIIIPESDTTTTTFLQTTQDVDESLNRDEDEAPEEDAEPEEEYQEGQTVFILATTFITGDLGTGKVYMIPKDDPENYSEVVIGLDEPVGVCFDVNHNFLYVADQGSLTEGGIYQYQINWSPEDETFALDNEVYVKIYSGTPSDCKVDAYGNLYFTDAINNSINKVTYSDLYSGFINSFVVLYEPDDETTEINRPFGIEVYESEDIYFVNNADGTLYGTLNKAEAEIEETNEENINILTEESTPAWGLALGEEYAYYSLDNGDINAHHIDDKSTKTMSSGFFVAPRGLCYGDGDIYVTDNGYGAIYKLDEGEDNNEPELMFFIQAVTSCFCVNVEDTDGAWIVSVALSMVFLFN